MIFGIGALESINHNGKLSVNDMFENSNREVGQFSLPIYGANFLKGKSAAEVADIKLKELKNGRLAMLAIGGLVHQQIIAGSDVLGSFPNPGLWSLY
ncbi:MAG: hypothetical protein K2Z81_25010 [Cyanobacteria bacterium]|nr:hypothetical protein [Cyanobacteriota bacterium]